MWAFDWWGFGADPLLRFSDSYQRASANWLLTGLRSATGGEVWNTGVGTGIGVSTQSRSSLTWGTVEGSIPRNSEGSTRSGDGWGYTRVQGVPNWRCLDLLGRPKVKRPIVWLARGIELLLEEGAADWWDIRIKTWQELVWVCKFCQGWNLGGQRYKVIDRNYTPEQSNVLCQRGIILSDSIKKVPADRQGHQSGEQLIERPWLQLMCCAVTPLENFLRKCSMGYNLYLWISLLEFTLETSYKPQT